jgi:uncharacterized phage infection (PIP) family protein YhgE
MADDMTLLRIAELERRIDRVEGALETLVTVTERLNGAVESLAGTTNRHLKTLIDLFTSHEKRLFALEQVQHFLVTQVTKLGESVQRVVESHQALLGRVERLEQGQQKLEQGQHRLIGRMDQLEAGLGEVKKGQQQLSDQFHTMDLNQIVLSDRMNMLQTSNSLILETMDQTFGELSDRFDTVEGTQTQILKLLNDRLPPAAP